MRAKCFLVLIFLSGLSFRSFARSPASSPEGQALRLTVALYNYAQVPGPTLEQAKHEANRIFRETQVQLDWLDVPLGQEEPSEWFMQRWNQTANLTRLVLRILPESMAAGWGFGGNEFGAARIDENDGFGQTADLFYHRVEELALLQLTPPQLILGHVMAHELGHLLLGSESHSARGIMHVPWDQLELRRAKFGRLVFTPQQGKRIRAQILKRIQEARAGDQPIANADETRQQAP